MTLKNPRSVLITGISGGLAQMTSQLLSTQYPEVNIWGIDNRPLPRLRESAKFKMERIPYTRGGFERLFRDHRFDLVLHLGRFSHSLVDAPDQMRRKLEFSVIGTKRILDLSLKNGVQKIITLSTFHVYGALANNPAYINEEMPLRASLKYSGLRHVVDMDNVVTNWTWKHQNEMQSIIFRPCNIIGPRINNTISKYLSYRSSPYPIDYNPILQFIHEFDMANLITYACENIPTGVYNAAPNEMITLRQALKIVGNHGVPIPFVIGKLVARMIKSPLSRVPDYLIDYLIYSCLIDNSALTKHLPPNFFRFPLNDSLKTLQTG